MPEYKHTSSVQRVLRFLGAAGVVVSCTAISFIAGVFTVANVPHDLAGAQPQGTTRVNIVLQYKAVDGAVRPLEVPVTLNGSRSPLVQLVEIHSGFAVPSSCVTTSSTGRCSVTDLPVGGVPERQYDVVADLALLEFVTRIPFEHEGHTVLFDQGRCNGTDTFAGPVWCLSRSSGQYHDEYFLTMTLRERNVCLETNPPASLCDAQGRVVSFRCNLAYPGSTAPFEPVVQACGSALCPDGSMAPGRCANFSGTAACSTFAACVNHQRCSVANIAQLLPYTAGSDTIVIRGTDFGTEGGTVTFPTVDGGTEAVRVYPGAQWKDKEIRVPVPALAKSGVLRIHPVSHGFTEIADLREPITCETPPVTVRTFFDQFALLDVAATSPQGVQLVSPGFDTVFSIAIRHNERLSRLEGFDIQLVQGAYANPEAVPLNRTIIARAQCGVEPANPAAREDIVACTFPVPENAAAYAGPYTFVITLFDDTGRSQSAVLLDGGGSAMVGDLDSDGRLTIADAVLAMRIVRGALIPSAAMLLRDPNQDGMITEADVLSILHSLTRL